MQFYPDKCQILRISKRRTKSDFNYSTRSSIIEHTREAKYLGITISDTLSHINNISKNANGTINFLHRNFKNCSPKSKLVFTSLMSDPLLNIAALYGTLIPALTSTSLRESREELLDLSITNSVGR